MLNTEETYFTHDHLTQDQINNNNNDVEFLKKIAFSNDGILILNKQIEDLTFYVDELKSELEAEKEKNIEYAGEIKDLTSKLKESDEQNNFTIIELRCENERLQKEIVDALFKAKEHEKLIKSLQITSHTLNNDDNSDNPVCNGDDSGELKQKFKNILQILKDELIVRKNFDIIPSTNEISTEFESDIEALSAKLKDEFQKKDNQAKLDLERIKNFESQLERIITDFKEEIRILEQKLAEKQNEFDSYKSRVKIYFIFIL